MKGVTHNKFYIVAGVAIVAFVSYGYVHQPSADLRHRKTAAVYDYSVKTGFGQAIKVVRAIDGDTVELVNGDRLRYIGIDTPEEVDPRKPVQCFAKEAAVANKNLVEGKTVVFYKDISDRDKYGRWLGFVYLNDGTFVNRILVREGFAFAYPYKPDITDADELQLDETNARRAGHGLWAACTVYRTSDGREQTSTI